MNTKLEAAFLILIALVLVIEAVWIFKTEKRLKKFFMGKKAKNLEDVIFTLQSDLDILKKSKQKTEAELATVKTKLKKSIRGLETVRFNPFPDQGSKQSFVVGLLDEEGDGVVFSSLYSRERMSVFAKPVKNGKSEYELTAEEKEVLEKAKVKN